MAAAIIEVESTLTDRYQTTVPEPVRTALHLDKRDKIHYSILDSGEVLLSRAELPELPDPVVGSFLQFLAADLAQHPERIQAVGQNLAQRLEALVAGDTTPLDLNAPLNPDDE